MDNHASGMQRRLQRAAALAAATTALLTMAACASAPQPPSVELAVGRAAVERANGPASVDAPVELAAARGKLVLAQMAYDHQDHAQARRLAEQAEADATLAEAQARSVRSDKALAEVREALRQLREEMARK